MASSSAAEGLAYGLTVVITLGKAFFNRANM
jgi:hypothetical protein